MFTIIQQLLDKIFKPKEGAFECLDGIHRYMPMVTANWLVKKGKWKNMIWHKRHFTHTIMWNCVTKEYFAVENLR